MSHCRWKKYNGVVSLSFQLQFCDKWGNYFYKCCPKEGCGLSFKVQEQRLLLPTWSRCIFFQVVAGLLVLVFECSWQVVDPLVSCQFFDVVCWVLTADCRVSLSLIVVCSWLSGVGCWVLIEHYFYFYYLARVRLNITINLSNVEGSYII